MSGGSARFYRREQGQSWKKFYSVRLRELKEHTEYEPLGASDQPGNLGGETVRRLLKFGFTGTVTPVSRSSARRLLIPTSLRRFVTISKAGFISFRSLNASWL